MTITLTIEPRHLLDDTSLDRISLRELIVIARSQSHLELDLTKTRESEAQTALDEEDAITWEDAEWR